MIGNKWFCEPDPFREKYCFLYSHTTPKGEKQTIKDLLSENGKDDTYEKINQAKVAT
jgi:hypothetical protein